MDAIPPLDFFCPLLHTLMRNPVICSDGISYEQDAISAWLRPGRMVSPVTGQLIQRRWPLFSPNNHLKMAIGAWCSKNDKIIPDVNKKDLEFALSRVERKLQNRNKEKAQEMGTLRTRNSQLRSHLSQIRGLLRDALKHNYDWQQQMTKSWNSLQSSQVDVEIKVDGDAEDDNGSKISDGHRDNDKAWKKKKQPKAEFNLNFSSASKTETKESKFLKLPGTLNSNDIIDFWENINMTNCEGINCMVCLAGDEQFATGGADGMIRFWELKSFDDCVDILKAHEFGINHLLVLDDGRLVSASNDIRLWDPSTKQCLGILKSGISQGVLIRRAVWSLVSLPSGLLASASSDPVISVWDPVKMIKKYNLEGHEKGVKCFALLPNGQLASGSNDLTIKLWDLEAEIFLFTLRGHQGAVLSVSSAPGGNLASASADATIRIWDLDSNNCIHVLVAHRGPVLSVIGVQITKQVISSSKDGTVRIWNENGELIDTLRDHDEAVTCLMTMTEEKNVLSGTNSGIIVWGKNAKTAEEGIEYRKKRRMSRRASRLGIPLKSVSFQTVDPPSSSTEYEDEGDSDDEGDDETSESEDERSINCSWECIRTLIGHTDTVNAIALLPENKIASSAADGTIRVWDFESGNCVSTFAEHKHQVPCLISMEDGTLISGSLDKMIKVWDCRQSKCIQSFQAHDQPIWSLAMVNYHGHDFASGSYDKTIKTWSLKSNKALSTLKGHTESIWTLRSMRNGKLASGSEDNHIKLWDLNSSKCKATLEGHKGPVWGTGAFPDDGESVGLPNHLVSCSDDSTIKIWNLGEENDVLTFRGHKGGVLCLRVLPNSDVITGSDDESIRLWDVTSRNCIARLDGHDGPVRSVEVLPTGGGTNVLIASGSSDHTIKIWQNTE